MDDHPEFCKEYRRDTTFIKWNKSMTVVLIVVINVIAKVMIRKLVEKVGHKTLSQKMKAILNLVFYA